APRRWIATPAATANTINAATPMISGRRESPEYIGARFRPERLAEEPAERAGCFLLMAAREWNSQWRASKRLSPEFPPARRPAPPPNPRAWRRAAPCRVG